MGGDFGPSITVPAALQVLSSHLQTFLFLVGNPKIISSFLLNADSNLLKRLAIIPSQSVIKNNDKVSQAIRNSHGSSMRIALELVQNGQAHACISAGNTGALMGLSKILLKPLSGIERPALMSILKHKNHGNTVMLDLGANIDSNSDMLVQFAIMGVVIAEEILNIFHPRVSLLNIGKEENKGTQTIHRAAMYIKEILSLNYIGYLESSDVLTGKTDVLICDGLIGNMVLKTMEGLAKIFFAELEMLHINKKYFCFSKLMRYIINKTCLVNDIKYLNPNQYNGACLLGLNGTVIKSHGAANQNKFAIAIIQAENFVYKKIPQLIAARLSTVFARSDRS